MRWILEAAPPRSFLQAMLTVIVTTAVLYLLRLYLSTPIIALLYLLPVGVSTTVWGLGAGITAAVAAFFTFNFFFLLPYYSLTVHQTQDLLVLFIFLVVAVVISQLVGRAQKNLIKAQTREYEATHLYEMSIALVGLREQAVIAQTVAEHIHQVFQTQAVQITVQTGQQPISVSTPSAFTPTSAQSAHRAYLGTARGARGEIRLWRTGRPFTADEERLLQTFASQGALALEYASLADAETRARVLEESDRLKTALLSSVSHDLRTPLVTIKAAATSLLSSDMSWEVAARQELLTAVATEADRLNLLVGHLLDMSRIEAGVLQPQRQWSILADIVGMVVARLRRASTAHEMEITISEDFPLTPVDHVQMDQVFTNLLSNCLKYAPVGTKIQVQAWTEGEQARVQVSNQGPGVPEEALAQMFDKFYQVTTMPQSTGAGLGLSICKGIVEAHNGRIWAENLPDGFAYNFTLPLIWDGMSPPQLPTEES
jgi:two-component system, OmpR family, sensor histidine kinase KdpD